MAVMGNVTATGLTVASLLTAATCPALHLDILVHLLDITEIFLFLNRTGKDFCSGSPLGVMLI